MNAQQFSQTGFYFFASCGMVGYNPTTSIVNKRAHLGNFGREHNFLRIPLVQLIYDLSA